MLYCWKPSATWTRTQTHCSNNVRKTQSSLMNKLMIKAIRGCYFATLSSICSLQLVTNHLCKIVPTAPANCARKRMVSELHLEEHSARSAPVFGSVAYP